MAIAIWTVVVLGFVLFLMQYHWKRRHIYRLAASLPGPPALPIIGNGLTFLGKDNDVLKRIREVTAVYPAPLRFWLGPQLIIYFSHPQHIERILSSSKITCKPELYDMLKVYVGDGLVSNSGPKYKLHRKLIQPLFNLKFSSENMEVFQKHINVFLDALSSRANGKENINIHQFLNACLADIIGETFLGTEMGAQYGRNSEFRKASTDLYEVGHARLTRPWLHPDFIYSLTKAKKLQMHISGVTSKFIQKAIDQANIRSQRRTQEEKESAIANSDVPIIDQIAEIIDSDRNLINSEDFLHHMFTLYLASEDTMTTIASILSMCFGMYPEYQKIAAEEVRTVLGENPKEITYEHLTKLNYLDMCIRDVLRLIPIAPIIIRKVVEDFPIDKMVVPRDCIVMVSIFDVHRNPEHWENPDHFHPDHFLPEAAEKRHPFAFVPFSFGPRNCIGKVFAQICLKFLMANILQRFEIEADGKLPDVQLKTDISIRSASGYNVRLMRRTSA